MSQVQLFEYAVLLQGKENTKTGEVTSRPELIVKPEVVLAKDAQQAQLLAGRAIPEEYMDRLERLTLVVRPF